MASTYNGKACTSLRCKDQCLPMVCSINVVGVASVQSEIMWRVMRVQDFVNRAPNHMICEALKSPLTKKSFWRERSSLWSLLISDY